MDSTTRDSLARRTQELAAALVRRLLAEGDQPAWVLDAIRDARLAGKLRARDIEGVPLFATTAGTEVTWDAIVEQHTRFGNVWYTSAESTVLPLDEHRIALRFDGAPPTGSGLRLIDATGELARDAEARANMARPAAASLALTDAEQRAALAIAELAGDGVTAPRGRVAVLAAGGEAQRGVRVHRAMHPLGTQPDPCDWPTVAVVDDARLTPDRIWAAPDDDRAWKALQATIRAASERALGDASPAPTGALADRELTATSGGEAQRLAEAGVRLRGRLWIDDDPAVKPVLVMIDRETTRQVVASVPVRGAVLALIPWRLDLATVIDDLCRDAYPELVRAAARTHGSKPAVIAHVVAAIEHRYLTREQAKALGAPGHAALERLRRPRPAAPVPAPVAPAPAAPPPDPLAERVHQRLIDLGLGAHVRAVVRDRRHAGVAYHANGVVCLGEDAGPLAPFLDALVAHVVTVLNEDLTEVTDATEAHAIGRLLEGGHG